MDKPVPLLLLRGDCFTYPANVVFNHTECAAIQRADVKDGFDELGQGECREWRD